MTAITGTALTPEGVVKPSARITLRRLAADVTAQAGGFVIPDDITVLADKFGEVDFDILPGQYLGSTLAIGNRAVEFNFNVANVASADFADCVGAAWVPIPPDSVTQAQESRDDAEAAASAAALSASSASASAASANAALTALGGVLNVTDGSDITTALTNALATYAVVTIPPGSYTVGTWVLPSNRVVKMDGVTLTHSVAQFMTATGAVKSSLIGGEIVGPHSGNSYQIILTDCIGVTVNTKMSNGNSGVNLIRCVGCSVEISATEMRGTGIRLSGSSNNKVSFRRGRNNGGFGVYVSLDGSTPSEGNSIFSEKYADPATLTAYQTSGVGSSFYDPVTGRIGLEAVGVTVGNNFNTINAIARDTQDNGVSITSDNNTGSLIIAENCDNDGLHLYGSNNSFTGVSAKGNAQSGIGIAQSSTTGTASNNTVVGSSVDNEHYGVRFDDVADGNTVIASVGAGNLLGKFLDDSAGVNTITTAAAGSSASAQVSFIGVTDLSPNYSIRTAYFHSDLTWCDFMLSIRFTPTYTTPGTPGEFRIAIPGLPSASGTPALAVGSISGIVWPAGSTQITARFEGGAVMRVRASGPGVAPVSLTTDNFTSGVQVEFTITGRYPLA